MQATANRGGGGSGADEAERITGTMQQKRPRNVYCSPGERAAILKAAAAAGKSVSSFVLDRALDGGDIGRAGRLTEEERAELRDGVGRLAGLVGLPPPGAERDGGAAAPAGEAEQ